MLREWGGGGGAKECIRRSVDVNLTVSHPRPAAAAGGGHASARSVKAAMPPLLRGAAAAVLMLSKMHSAS